MIQPLEFKREYLHKNYPASRNDAGLEIMIDAALKYSAFDNTLYCTIYLMGLNDFDIKVLSKYAEAGYRIGIKTAHHCDDIDDIEVTVCYCY